MDPILICCSAILAVLISLVLTFICKIYFGQSKGPRLVLPTGQNVAENANRQPQRAAPVIVGGRRQNAAAAAARRRLPVRSQANEAVDDEQFSDDEGNFEPNEETLYNADGSKVGKKKAAKLQAKADKRAQRGAELEDREERKRREAEKAELTKKREEQEKKEELLRLEAEQKAKEEKERRELEEYLQLKQSFAVEEEGFDLDPQTESENALQEFINHIKRAKVVNMDELASHFKLRPQDVVDRVKTFVSQGLLTGVIDDRGKFIYITEQELLAVAKFINQRGRVTVAELVDYSNQLVDLEPDKDDVQQEMLIQNA